MVYPPQGSGQVLTNHKHSDAPGDGSNLDDTTIIKTTKLVDAIIIGVV
jgi:hypothetical protein